MTVWSVVNGLSLVAFVLGLTAAGAWAGYRQARAETFPLPWGAGKGGKR